LTTHFKGAFRFVYSIRISVVIQSGDGDSASTDLVGGSMQTMYANLGGAVHHLTLPDLAEEVLPGLLWGAFDELFTPAYWRGQTWQHQQLGTYNSVRLGRSLSEEVAACLLGGFGMPAELGVAAFFRLRDLGLLAGRIPPALLEYTLSEPLNVRGRWRTYRFPRQKARYLAACLEELASFCEPELDLELRDALVRFPGIGLKTASWIVRNYRSSNAVAVLDVHILRACRYMQLFPPELSPQQHYHDLEAIFLRFAVALGTPAAILDAVMWDYMRRLTRSAVTNTSYSPIEL
jgi:hypothetical protein